MAGICSFNPTLLGFRRIHAIQCCSAAPDNEKKNPRSKTPQILKLAVNGVTEILRLFSYPTKDREIEAREDVSVTGIDDVIFILKSDYENAYFVTGIFTSAVYADDCIFEDPTIRFQGENKAIALY